MPMSNADRYLDLIDATLRYALTHRPAAALPADGVPIECALLAVAEEISVPLKDEAALRARLAQAGQNPTFVDGLGHRRPMYRGLAVQALARSSATALPRVFIDVVLPRVTAFAAGSHPLIAADASDIVGTIFDAWAVGVLPASTADHRTLATACLHRLVAAQQSTGPFLTRTASDNPEPLWYVELALLHAVHAFAIDSRDTRAREAARLSARYHAAEVQPDHASNQPWALAALLDEPDGISLADTMLHAAGVQEPATMDAVSLLLLADASRCGRAGKTG